MEKGAHYENEIITIKVIVGLTIGLGVVSTTPALPVTIKRLVIKMMQILTTRKGGSDKYCYFS